jgi:hypothetical protein
MQIMVMYPAQNRSEWNQVWNDSQNERVRYIRTAYRQELTLSLSAASNSAFTTMAAESHHYKRGAIGSRRRKPQAYGIPAFLDHWPDTTAFGSQGLRPTDEFHSMNRSIRGFALPSLAKSKISLSKP